ncbi:hypothetical protein [Streptomyces kaempferi]|uniref:Transposase n=1 Tax=Streptomyces kaempferi TaxID=333725 RepID=A0ABW3XF94_9ACTN
MTSAAAAAGGMFRCHRLGILLVISRKGSPRVKGLGKPRYVVEQTFALFHHFE